MFTQTSEKEMTSCLVCGFLLRVGRVCKGYDKPLSGKNFPLEGPIWGVLQDTNYVLPVHGACLFFFCGLSLLPFALQELFID